MNQFCRQSRSSSLETTFAALLTLLRIAQMMKFHGCIIMLLLVLLSVEHLSHFAEAQDLPPVIWTWVAAKGSGTGTLYVPSPTVGPNGACALLTAGSNNSLWCLDLSFYNLWRFDTTVMWYAWHGYLGATPTGPLKVEDATSMPGMRGSLLSLSAALL